MCVGQVRTAAESSLSFGSSAKIHSHNFFCKRLRLKKKQLTLVVVMTLVNVWKTGQTVSWSSLGVFIHQRLFVITVENWSFPG